MADNARGIHVSPGIYSKETDITYAVKSLGITTLGLVGETLKGPAFQLMPIENWREYESMFGGTSTEKFKGSQYPKYELPYIAKSYLKESNQLQVCRVLGLSGYNAGPAWVITAPYNGSNIPIVVLRSRGHFEEYHKITSVDGTCECPNYLYDTLFYEVGEIGNTSNGANPKAEDVVSDCDKPSTYNKNAVKLEDYVKYDSQGNVCDNWNAVGSSNGFEVSSINHGKFKICGIKGIHASGATATKGQDGYFEYPVSLNASDKDYILNVLGTSPSDGDAPLYVESLFDIMLEQMIESNEITKLNKELTFYQVYDMSDYSALLPVASIMYKQENALGRRDVGTRYLADKEAVDKFITCHPYTYSTGKPLFKEEDGVTKLVKEPVKPGQIYTVVQYTDASGLRNYFYRYYKEDTIPESDTNIDSMKRAQLADKLATAGNMHNSAVLNNADGRYYRMYGADIAPITCDMNNYKDSYRFASTPWFVSNVKGDYDTIELNKLFRFHTISDGDMANREIKVSIQNIKPDEGVFDVIVRDINDTDESIVVLEKYVRCNLVPGNSNYISYRIGSYDGIYESKSKYITVEVNEGNTTENSVPCGFLGYPLSKFEGLQAVGNATDNVTNPELRYNLAYDQDVKNRKQYFGLSNRVGVDVDMFTYKGKAAYGDEPDLLSPGFHLDSRLDSTSFIKEYNPNILVDGQVGYKFNAVSINNRTITLDETPIIGSEAEMLGSIYENVDLRKFTAYFYGGFDGWDVYRDYRSNTDNFKMSRYMGQYNDSNGEGLSFNRIDDPESLGLNQVGFTSDWYAYLAGIRQFANPEAVDINVFATPGIDFVNNRTLVEETIEMIEEERADSIYVMTTPDKPFGANDYVNEMYTPDDIVGELEASEIDSNYTCTYYPWVKYEDVENSQYIFLPPTKDVVRNMALTDNTTYPWFAPAGISRGDVDCTRAKFITKVADEDTLYEGRINPIKTFASDGVKVWGQKNLQIRESQLNRIAVRRLLLRMRKLIAISCIGLIFDPNDSTTKNKFLSTVTPIMDNIKSNRGISDYRIEVNDTVESRERRELPAKIFFKPFNALEYIDLEFIVTPESVSFDNI